MRRLGSTFSVVSLSLLFQLTALSLLHTASPVFAGDNVWTKMSLEAASVQCLEIDPMTPDNIYVGSRRRVSRSSDGGDSWTGSSNGLESSTFVLDLAASPSTAGVLFAAGTDGQVRKSTDFGATFALSSGGVAPEAGTNSSHILFNPADTSIMYWTRSAGDVSVYKSTDSGANWIAAESGLPDASVNTLIIDPATPATLYATFSHGSGIYKTIDGAETWTAANTGLPSDGDSTDVGDLALDPSAPNTLWAESAVNYTLYNSTDGGGSWSQASTDTHYFSELSVHPTSGDLYTILQENALKRNNIYRSTNGGGTWTNLSAAYVDAYRLRFHPTLPGTFFSKLNEGVYKTTDGGTTWASKNAGLNAAEVRSIAVAPSNNSYLYVGTNTGPFKSTDGGMSFGTIIGSPFQSAVGTGNGTAVHPTDPMTVLYDVFTPFDIYHDDENWPPLDSGLVKTVDGGSTWSVAPNPHTATFGYGLGQTWTPLVYDPHSSSVVYAASVGNNNPASLSYSGVYTSLDGGTTYAHTSVGLPEGLLVGLSLVAVPTTPTTLLVGFGSFGIDALYRSTNAGSSWQDISTGTILEGEEVDALAVDPTDNSRILAGTRSAMIFMSTDGGDTWTLQSPVLEGGVRAIAHDPTQARIVLASAGSPYWSRDGGASWQPLTNGLPADPLVFDPVTIDPGNGSRNTVSGRVIAGTWEQGLWEIVVEVPLFADGFETGDTSAWAE